MNDTNALSRVDPQTLPELKDLCVSLAKSSMLPADYIGKPENIMAIALTGRDLGFSLTASMRTIDMIKGKPTLRATAQLALVKASPQCDYFQMIESTDKVATYETKRKGNPHPTRLSFTIEQAQRAGLLASNPTYQKFPDGMLRARASSALCQLEYPDVLLGFGETSEQQDVEREAQQKPPEREIPSELVDPPTRKSKGKADTVKVGGHRVEVVDVEFCPTTGEVAPEKPSSSESAAPAPAEAVVPQPAEQPATAEVPAPADPMLVKIEAATTVAGLRAVALEYGVIADPVRKAIVSAAYNAKMAALRGGQ